MAEPTVPYLSEDSILGWQRESTRGTAPATSSDYRDYGRVESFQTLGPQQSLARDLLINDDQEASDIIPEGTVFGPRSLGPFQIRDPLIIGYAWSKETNRSSDLGGGHYRHTLSPTDLGQLDSIAEGQKDQKNDGSGDEDAILFKETIIPTASIRGEAPTADGGGGRAMAAIDRMAHSAEYNTSKASGLSVSANTTEPYKWHHGKLTLDGTQVYRLVEFEFTINRRAQYAFYIRDDESTTPTEAPPEGAIYDFTFTAVADENQHSSDDLMGHLRNRTKFDGELAFTRTADEDEFDIQLTDVVIGDAPRQRGQGKVLINATTQVRQARFRYVDGNDSAHFST